MVSSTGERSSFRTESSFLIGELNQRDEPLITAEELIEDAEPEIKVN